MTRIIGSLVMKDEADRYLRSVLDHNMPFIDDLFVWDDQSQDSSRDIAREHTEHVFRRDDLTPSFIEHEGQFRYEAWKALEAAMLPQVGDWILAFDADEFLVHGRPDGDVATELQNTIDAADSRGSIGIVLPFPEIFAVIHGQPRYRVDGLWNTVRGPRLFRYQPGGKWSNKPMGCGAEPTYVAASNNYITSSEHNLYMLHYGYADPRDHTMKHERYTSLYDHGHNNKHIQSIIKPATLVPWEGMVPKLCVS